MLVGTVSIEKSERVAEKLKKTSVKHNVLNAKNHEREAEIVAQAGRYGAVTISTNMAGRGTDIVLGGNPESWRRPKTGTRDPKRSEFPGGTGKVQGAMRRRTRAGARGRRAAYSRHRAPRIAAYRQSAARTFGPPGRPRLSRFYISLEDDLLRIFGADRLKGLMERIGMEDGVPIEHRWISRAIENAQKKVEAHNFDIRKHLLEYDDVMNKQREVVYHRRRELLRRAAQGRRSSRCARPADRGDRRGALRRREGSRGVGLERDRGRIFQAVQVPPEFTRTRQTRKSDPTPTI